MPLTQSLALCEHSSGGRESTLQVVNGTNTPNVEILHLLDLQTWELHAIQYIWEQRHHVVVAHGHIGDDLLESILLGGVVLVLLSTPRKLLT